MKRSWAETASYRSDDSSLKVAVIHTDEEMIIAHQTVLLIGG
jgi:acetate kinase